MRIGLLIPEFPQQTHVAWWRVGRAMTEQGADVRMVSTRRPPAGLHCHRALIEASEHTFYVWPPKPGAVAREAARSIPAIARGLGYILRLPESSLREKLRLLPLIPAALNLRRWARQNAVDGVFVHSCANAAHLVALSRVMGGPRYALRLGGDLEVYGKDHAAKMARAEFVAAGAASYVPRIVNECGVPPERAFWTWVGVDTRTFTPAAPDQRRRRDPDEPLHAVTVARLTDTKGHVDALEAIAQLRDSGICVRYTIAGRGPEETNIRAAIDRLALGDRVSLVGALDQAQVIDLLRRADAFLLCSYGLGESTPAVVSEAMACGIPAISTIIGGTTDMIEPGVDGLLVPQRDVAAIAAALRQLAEDEPTRRAMAERALAKSTQFDCRRTARRVLDGFGLADREPQPDVALDGSEQSPNLQPRLSVLIVNYRSREMLADCLTGLHTHTHGVSYEVLVVDNSNDGTASMLAERFPWVRCIQNTRNLGFAAGNNLLAQHARGHYLLLLNPDTLVHGNALGDLVAFADQSPDAGAWGGLCVLPDGRPDPACFQRSPSLLRSLGVAIYFGRNWFPGRKRLDAHTWSVPVISGAFLMTTTAVWRELGGFDESFFMYNEEVDLCLRIARSGRRLLFTDALRITHIGGGGQRKSPQRIVQMQKGRMHLVRKHRAAPIAAIQGACTWSYHAQRYLGGVLLAPVLGHGRAKRLRDAHGPAALRPWQWWWGWSSRSEDSMAVAPVTAGQH